MGLKAGKNHPQPYVVFLVSARVALNVSPGLWTCSREEQVTDFSETAFSEGRY